MDIEGFEHFALAQGADAVLDARPILYVEICEAQLNRATGATTQPVSNAAPAMVAIRVPSRAIVMFRFSWWFDTGETTKSVGADERMPRRTCSPVSKDGMGR